MNCSVVGEFGGSDGVAGLVVCNRRSGTIRQSGAAGSVTAIGERLYLATGLAASNEGYIGGCHADGQVTGERCPGGLAGLNNGYINQGADESPGAGDDESASGR